MMKNNLTILISGATGQQGGAALEALLAAGHSVRILTRNPESEKARTLKQRDITVLQGDLQNKLSLEKALNGVDGFYLVTTPFEGGIEAEIEQGKIAVQVAKEKKINHLVFSSVADADQATSIPHFDSKSQIEDQIRRSGVPYTIIAPAYFYDNMLSTFVLPGLQKGTFAQALPANKVLQAISVKNIGEFVNLAFSHRNEFLCKRINIAGDEITGEQYAAQLSEVIGKEISYTEIPLDQVRAMSEDMALMYDWFNRVGYNINISKLKSDYPSIKWDSFKEWAKRQDWRVLEPDLAECN